MTSGGFWQRKSVFVTGGTGFLGGWLIKRLLENGANVVALIRDRSPQCMLVKEGYISRIAVVTGSLENLGLMRRALCEYSFDSIFHLAAQPLVGVAKSDPVGTLQANVMGTWNVLEAARQAKVGQIVVASSDKAYGTSDHLPYLETHPLHGKFPYDVSKSCADLICGMYAATYSLPLCVVRCANLFGGGDLNWSRTVPGVVRSTLRNEKFLIRSDGKFVRDFLYIKDAADAYLLVAEALANRPELAGQAFNFSLEVRLTVLDIARRVLALMDCPDLEPIIQNQASAEIREQYLDCDKARRVLGWAPRYGIDEALKETVGWYQAYVTAELDYAKIASSSIT